MGRAEGPAIVLVGPSGVGKSSLIDLMTKSLPSLEDIVTYTTRGMRPGESQGVPYHFIEIDDFRRKLKEDFFLEHAENHGNLYGTAKTSLLAAWSNDRVPIMDLDVRGARNLKSRYPRTLCVFVLPPSFDSLRLRLMLRERRQGADLETRLENARAEVEQASTFDRQLVNHDLKLTAGRLKKTIEDYLRSF